MTVGETSLSQPIIDAVAAGYPFGCGLNLQDDLAEEPVWSISGIFSNSRTGQGSNVDDTTRPTSRTRDRLPHLMSQPVALPALQQSVWLLFHFNPGVDDAHTIDLSALKIQLAHLPGNITVRIQVDNTATPDEDFGTPVTIATLSGAGNLFWVASRLAGPTLGTNAVLNNIDYLRIEITTDATDFGSFVPRIGQAIFAIRRQMGHAPTIPYDDEPRYSDVSDFVSKSGVRIRHVRNRGAQNLRVGLRPTPTSMVGIPELDNLRSLVSDTEHLTLPFLWVDDPVQSPAVTGLYMLVQDPVLDAPLQDFIDRTYLLTMNELPPYREFDDA